MGMHLEENGKNAEEIKSLKNTLKERRRTNKH
jgi:hypothetical protein